MKPLKEISKEEIEEVKKAAKEMKGYRQAAESNHLFAGICVRIIDESKIPMIWWTIGRSYENFFPIKESSDEAKSWIEKSKKSTGNIDRYLKKFFLRVKKQKKFYKKAEKIDFKKISIEETRKFLKQVDAFQYEVWGYNSFLCDKFDPKGDIFLKEELKRNNLQIENEEIGILLKPHKASFVDESNLDLYKIAEKLKQKGKTSDNAILKALKLFAKKFYFIQNSWNITKILKENDFVGAIKEILKEPEERIKKIISNYENLEENTKKKCGEIYNKYNINEEMQNVFHLFRCLAEIRDKRKESVVRTVHFYELIAKKISEEYDADINLLHYAFSYELYDISNKEDMKRLFPLLKERAVATMFGKIKQDELFIINGKDAMPIINLIHSKLLAGIEDIKGMVACRGSQNQGTKNARIITGRVKIILGETHFTKFNEGEILVAPMTRPEYIPLMKKAKAIITDEGGITCHAAIVSRELGVPCIIGTGMATKKLFDNREVEIDTETGIIKMK